MFGEVIRCEVYLVMEYLAYSKRFDRSAFNYYNAKYNDELINLVQMCLTKEYRIKNK